MAIEKQRGTDCLFSKATFKIEVDNYPYPFNEKEAFTTIVGKGSKYYGACADIAELSCKVIPGIMMAINHFIISNTMPADAGFGGTAYTKDKMKVVGEYHYNPININPVSFVKAYNEDPTSYDFLSEERVCCIYNLSTGKVNGNTVTKVFESGSVRTPYILSTDKVSPDKKIASPIFFVMLRDIYEKDEDFRNRINLITDFYSILAEDEKDDSAKQDIITEMAIRCDTVYRKINNYYAIEAVIPGDGMKIDLSSTNILTITDIALSKLEIDDATVNGSLSVFLSAGVKKSNVRTRVAGGIEHLRGVYAPSDRELTEAELNLVPVIDKSYEVPEEIYFVGEHIKAIPEFRNFLFRGPAGTGKTEGVKILAYMMNRPYYFITCSADSEIYDLTMQVIPDVQDGEGEKVGIDELMKSMPSTFDIAMDPPSVYLSITGEEKADANEQDCMYAISMKIMANLKERKASFKYVDSPLITAIRTGGLCEIQEPNVIMKPGVLVGLNALFDKTATIQLMTGEQIKRHPDAVVVMTTNSEYEGIRPMNQSVISRMNMVIDFELPSDEILVDRVMAASGYEDRETVIKMVKVLHSMEKECERNGATDGSLGVRELISWATSAKVTKDVYRSAFYTVIGSATSDIDVRTMLINCLNSQFDSDLF